ncbi:MAG: hypothetical protein WAK95_00965 [Desulfobacterales bacterium]
MGKDDHALSDDLFQCADADVVLDQLRIWGGPGGGHRVDDAAACSFVFDAARDDDVKSCDYIPFLWLK